VKQSSQAKAEDPSRRVVCRIAGWMRRRSPNTCQLRQDIRETNRDDRSALVAEIGRDRC
jgi:hypothetical protein